MSLRAFARKIINPIFMASMDVGIASVMRRGHSVAGLSGRRSEPLQRPKPIQLPPRPERVRFGSKRAPPSLAHDLDIEWAVEEEDEEARSVAGGLVPHRLATGEMGV